MTHLTSEDFAAYVSRAIHGPKLDRLEEHFEGCEGCRDELVAVAALLRNARGQRRRRVAGGAVLTAAALSGVALLGTSIERILSEREPVLRGGGVGLEEGVRSFSVVTPRDGARLAASSGMLFAWRAVAPAAFYSLTVTDERGDLVWRGSTSDTLLQLPSNITIRPGSRYFWFVEALLADGTTATTDANGFWTAP